MGWPAGIEPASPESQPGALPLSYGHHHKELVCTVRFERTRLSHPLPRRDRYRVTGLRTDIAVEYTSRDVRSTNCLMVAGTDLQHWGRRPGVVVPALVPSPRHPWEPHASGCRRADFCRSAISLHIHHQEEALPTITAPTRCSAIVAHPPDQWTMPPLDG